MRIIERLLKLTDYSHELLRFKANVIDLKTSQELNGNIISEKESEKQYELAYTLYLSILKTKPDYVPAIIDIGDYWERKGMLEHSLIFYDNAIELLEKGIFGESLKDEVEEAFYNKAMVLKELKRHDEAEFSLARGRKYNPDSILLKNNVQSVTKH